MRLIDADRLVKCFCAHCTSMGEDGVCCEGGDCFDKKIIDTTPTVEAEQGRWIEMNFFYQPGTQTETANFSFYACSNCGWTRRRVNRYKYCPECGARMDSEVEE